jgi:hypothetical protein
MKNLITEYTGGLPLVADDINFLQNNFKDNINSAIQLFSEVTTIFIISGGELNGNTWTAGKLFHNGEIYEFDEYTFTGDERDVYIHNVITYEPIGNKLFKSGLSYNTYQVLSAYLDKTSTGGETFNYEFYMIPRLEQLFITKSYGSVSKMSYLSSAILSNYVPVWNNMSLSTGILSTLGLKYTKNPYGVVSIKGTVYRETAANEAPSFVGSPGAQISTLNAECRPVNSSYFKIRQAAAHNTYAYPDAYLYVQSNGNVNIFIDAIGTNTYFSTPVFIIDITYQLGF